ncbi:sulfatase family protein [Rhodothermus marinus]|uniref:sulfatase family protein n=1 Tax=Rhodothermus marinus TaxID=29549 RepID=UPI0012BA477B|nr:sulfatase [Rhodothermus marinus]BBM72565.1 acetylglucosamine-6-sulfatase [Rhodothermus marinus]
MRWLLILLLTLMTSWETFAQFRERRPQNVVLILSDDHRYDFMSFMDQAPDFLETPGMDRMAREGAHLRNAFVTTSLCSPSRASILTGQYAHRHGVVDNTTPVPPDVRFFPQDLQAAGYRTAFIGKWHMGEADDHPRPGFDYWVSFRGQGVYYNPTLNVNGLRVRREGYITDLLTDYAIEWLRERAADGAPFFLYLSHKAVHAEFEPAERYAGRYAGVAIPYPPTMANTESNYRNKPHWVQAQRKSWHGVDYAYHGQFDFDTFYRRYAETLLALDESISRVLDFLEQSGLAENTLVIYMSDNGFLLGEHGLIDKRNAYEESIRIPMLAWAPGYIAPGAKIDALVRNIDIAPTILELTGVSTTILMDGRSFLGLLTDPQANEEDREFLYEYYWEYAFPHTPTTFALRGDRFKYIFYHGIWDIQELYDLELDPLEQHNLIFVPAYQSLVQQMRNRLFDLLEEADAMRVPVRRGSWQAGERKLD